MQDYSFIPVTLKPGKNGKVKKIPNSELLKRATGVTGWSTFQTRKPTAAEQEIFMQSSHIAIVTGEISGITVIDLDGSAEQDLLKQGYELPHTPTVKTQSGGKHLYFKYDERMKTASKINNQQNIDCRNDGGYVVAFGEGYEWLHHINTTKLQEVPDIFLNMAHRERTQADKRHSGGSISESVTDAYSKARNVNMVTFLRHHGYNVQEHHLFSCIFDNHADENPSAQIVTNKNGEQRYICYSHSGGKTNLSLIDLWAELNHISIQQAIEQVLSFVGIEYKESAFIKAQKDKYHFNTIRISDLDYILNNFAYLHKYMNRYELELRALMDYAESNLHGTNYSYNGQAVFYISKRYASNIFAKAKGNSTLNTKRANTLLNILCTLGIMERVPSDKLTEYAQKSTKKLQKEGREINFFAFNQLTDYVLSVADQRAKTMQESNFKVSAMTKDILISIFGHDIANKVFPDFRQQSGTFKKYKDIYSRIILQQIEKKGFTTKQETIKLLDLPLSQRKKEYHFDKVINEICNTYGLEFNFATAEIKARFNLTGRGRKRLIYRA